MATGGYPRRTTRLLGFALAALLIVAAPSAAQLSLTTYVNGLTQPVGFVQDPSNPALQYVVEQLGTLRVIQNGVLLATPFLNVSSNISAGGERGLLGLAFPPDYGATRRFYVFFTNPAGDIVVARFLRSAANPLVADFSSRFDLRWDGPGGQRFIPHREFPNHNGGHLAFGPDGYLYIGIGDGGSGNDPHHASQDPATGLGKLLRIDVSVGDSNQEGYVVPADNPFLDSFPVAALPEIWAFGLRNPWHFAFDPPALGGTGALLIGDVGQTAWEEVDYQPPGVGGRNYGWRNREGAHVSGITPVLAPAYTPLVDPIIEYDRTVGQTVIGGVVYRGSAMRSTYRGRYFYADWVQGRVFSVALMPVAGGEVTASAPLEHTAELGGVGRIGNVTAFGIDSMGEVYLVSYYLGAVLKLSDPRAPTVPPPTADFNRDRKPDLVWFHEVTRQLAAWNMGGGTLGDSILSGTFLSAPALPPGWRVVGTDDADGDGQTDLYLQSDAGLLGVWLFDGPVYRYGLGLNPSAVSDPAWRVKAVADFNHDGHPDLVWQYGPTGQVAFWLLNGINVIGYVVPSIGAPGPDWQIVGTGDANGDGEIDLYWQHRTQGSLAVWRMTGTQYLAGLWLSASPSDPAWRVVGTCDLDRDGSIDLLFRNESTGSLGAWYLDRETIRFGLTLTPSNAGDLNWRVVGPR